MSETFSIPGQPCFLMALLSDGEESLPIRVKAVLKNMAGTTLNTVELTHVGSGLFAGSFNMPDLPVVIAQYFAFEEDGTTPADYDLGYKVFTQSEGLDPKDIWEYNNRTLTDEVQIDTAEVMGEIKTELDKVVERLENFQCMMTSVLDNASGRQTLICYLNKNGQTLLSTSNARVVVYDDAGAAVWSGESDAPDLRGVFKIVKDEAEVLFSRDKVYTVKVTIKHNTKDYFTNQTFFTVG